MFGHITHGRCRSPTKLDKHKTSPHNPIETELSIPRRKSSVKRTILLKVIYGHISFRDNIKPRDSDVVLRAVWQVV